jgi:hypothetical protein
MSYGNSLRARFTFGIKLAAALLLVALADILFFRREPGSTLGVFALAWTLLLPVAVRPVRRHTPALGALGLSGVMALVLADQPGPLAAILFWIALSSAPLLALGRSADGLHHGVRLVAHGLRSIAAPLRDAKRVVELPRADLRGALFSLAGVLALPVIGGLVFVALFAQANPIVARLLPDIAPAFPGINVGRMIFWSLIFMLAWPSLRPRYRNYGPAVTEIPLNLPGVSLMSITLSLLLFNLLFGVENLLDIVFLWSGAPLPADISMAEYAHRGAYPLIVTALLAGAFVLLTARPDSAIGRNRRVRLLVVAWIIQNLILVTSSIIRTVGYIDAYMLTRLRLAALVWMGLVAAGLILICWRMVAGRSLAWLVNAVLACALVVLFAASVIDFGSVAAGWNVRHAREVGGDGQPLDLAYMRELGPSALVALAKLEANPLTPEFRARVAPIRQDIQRRMEDEQRAPFGWTWRAARRLNAARSISADAPGR